MSIIDTRDIESNLDNQDWEYDPDVTRMHIDYSLEVNKKPVSTRTTKEIADSLELQASNQKAKTRSIKTRRKEFARTRAESILLMLDSGIDYICCVNDCEETEFLSVDHIKPLSKGGNDDLNNLQFMCKSHNSSKSDR